MVTIQRNMSRYISARKPVVTVRMDARAIQEKRECQRELAIFDGFVYHPLLTRMKRVLERAEKLHKEVDRIRMFRKITLRSFAKTAKKNARSTGVQRVMVSPIKKNTKAWRAAKYPQVWSRYQMRRDYADSWETMREEREEARSLAEAIAARYAKPMRIGYKRPQVMTVSQATQRQRRAYFKRCHYQARHPAKEVKNFPKGCEFYPGPEILDTLARHGIPDPPSFSKLHPMEEREPWDHFPKKQRRVTLCKSQEFHVRIPRHVPEKLTRVQRAAVFMQSLSKTPMAQCLAMGIMSKRHQLAIPSPVVLKGQMDEEGVMDEVPTSVEKKSNVVIRGEALNVMRPEPVPSVKGFMDMAISKQQVTLDRYVDRWMLLDTFDWSTADTGAKALKKYSLPDSLLKSENFDVPNLQMFLTHRYCRGNLKVKVLINSNPFQIGSLMVSWLYQREEQYGGEFYDSTYSASQRMHGIISAAASNEIELAIPYNYPNSVMCLRDVCQMGELSIQVLNQLAVVESVSTSCKVSVFVSFEDFEFFGMISRSLGVAARKNPLKGQMDTIGALCNVGSNLLSSVGRDLNRDNPPLPAQPGFFVPTAMQSFAYMDHIPEPLNVLRSDPRGQTPHPLVTNEMDILSICKTPGLLDQVKWDKDSTIIYSTPVVPLMSAESYHEESKLEKQLTQRVYPPVAIMASMFAKWRGEITYHFKIIGSKFHTGRLMVCVLPRVTGDQVKGMSVATMRNSPYEIIEVRGSTEFSYTVPWYWDNAWANVRGMDGKVDIPSHLVVVVLNSLIAINSVPSSMYVNVFVSAGHNFELALSRMPILGVGDDRRVVLPTTEYLHNFNTEIKVYTTWERNLKRSDGGYGVTYYIQNVTDGWVGFLDARLGHVYERSNLTTSGLPFRCLTQNPAGGTIDLRYGVYDPALSTTNAHGLIMAPSYEIAWEMAQGFLGATTDDGMQQVRMKGIKYLADSGWSEVNKGSTWVPAENGSDQVLWKVHNDLPKRRLGVAKSYQYSPRSAAMELEALNNQISQMSVSVDRIHNLAEKVVRPTTIVVPGLKPVQGQMDEVGSSPLRSNDCVTQRVELEKSAISTGMGLQTFGERIDSLKSLGRRWIHYCSLRSRTMKVAHPRDAVYFARFPVTPKREINPVLSADYDNRVRDGVISVMSTGYQYWRGGLRFRFMVVGNPPEGTTMYIQHRFDEKVDNETPWVEYGSKVRTALDMLTTQYATFAQSLSVNQTATVEVPYYREQEKLEIRNSTKNFSANGKVYVWVNTPQPTTISIEVYYSLGDDMQMSIFQGFPAMVELSDINDEEKVTGQMDEAGYVCPNQKRALDELAHATREANVIRALGETCGLPEPPKPQGLSDACKYVKDTVVGVVSAPKKISDSAQQISVSAQQASTTIADNSSRLTQMMDSLKSMISRGKDAVLSAPGAIWDYVSSAGSQVYSFFSHLVYAVISPTKDVVVWALINIYNSIWGFTMSGFTKLSEALRKMWDYVFNPRPQGPVDDDPVARLCSQLYVCFTTFFCIKSNPVSLSDWKGVAKNLFSIGLATRSADSVGKFISGCFELLKRVYSRVLEAFGWASNNKSLLTDVKDKRLKAWIVEAMAMTASTAGDQIFQHPEWAEKVFELSVVGRGIQVVLADKSLGAELAATRTLVSQLMQKIMKIEKQLVDQKVHSTARYEPFCLWIAGDAGAGKSHYAQQVATDLSEMLGYDEAQSYYPRSAGQKYFDGYKGQPTIFQDDFLSASIGVDPESYTQFLQMKSPVLFNPPYAEAEEKDKFINFANLIISSNIVYFRNMVGIHDLDAYNRRRDLLLEFRKLASVKNDKSIREQFTPEQLSELEHVRVFHHQNVHDGDHPNTVEILRVKDEPYSMTVKRYIDGIAASYHTQESIAYARRVARNQARLSIMADPRHSLSDYLEKVRKTLNEVEGTNKTSLDKALSDWIDMTKEATVFKLPKVAYVKDNVSVKPVKNTLPTKKKKSQKQGQVYSQVHWVKPFKEKSKEKEKKVMEATASQEAASTLSSPIQGQSDGKGKVERRLGFITDDLYDPLKVTEPLNDEDSSELYSHYPHDSQGLVIEPIDRVMNGWPMEQYSGIYRGCIHKIFRPENVIFGPHMILSSGDLSGSQLRDFAQSVPWGLCGVVSNGAFEPCPDCIFFNPNEVEEFAKRIILSRAKSHPIWFEEISDLVEEGEVEILGVPGILLDKIKEFINLAQTYKRWSVPISVATEMNNVRASHVSVGSSSIPKKPKKGWLRSAWDSLLEFLKTIWGVISGIVKVVGIILGGLTLMNWVKGEHSMSAVPGWDKLAKMSRYTPLEATAGQIHASGDFVTSKRGIPIKKRVLDYMRGNVDTGEMEQECLAKGDSNLQAIKAKLVKNCFFLVFMKENGRIIKLRCLGLYNRKFIILKHYVDFWKGLGISKVMGVFCGGRGTIEFETKDLNIRDLEEGYSVGEFPASLPFNFLNIVKFMPSVEYGDAYPAHVEILEIFRDMVIEHHLEAKYLGDPIMVPQNGDQRAWTITQGFAYEWGGDGRCGSLIIAPNMKTPLIGIHTSGRGSSVGFAEMLLRETFQEKKKNVIEYIMPQMGEHPDCDLEGEYVVDAVLPRDEQVFQPAVTKIKPSVIHGVFPVSTEPAPLSAEDPRLSVSDSPLRVGTSKRCDKLREFDNLDVAQAVSDVKQKVLLKVKPIRTPAVLTIKQAVEGLPLEGYEPINMTSSEGYPWVKLRPSDAKNKKWLFDLGEYEDGRIKVNGIHPDLHQMLELKQQMREKALVPRSPFVCCLKDARILKEKVNQVGKTRVFEISPIDLTIAQRQYFLDFIAAYQTARTECENTIGINPDGPEWSELANSLHQFSPFILTADFSSYGPRMSARILEEVFGIEIAWYLKYERADDPKKNALVREVIMHEVVHGPHVYKNIMFRPTAGMPSGNPATVQKNSLANSLYIRIAFLGIMKKLRPNYCDMYWFNKLVRLYHNGDDLIIAVKDVIIDVFNNITLIEFFAEYGLKMTDATKSGKVQAHCTIDQATYLKRGFVRHPFRQNHWLAPLSMSSILDTANWIWKTYGEKEASLVNSEMCARLAYSQGERVYDEVVARLIEEWAKENVLFEAPSWRSLDSHIWEGTQGPLFKVNAWV